MMKNILRLIRQTRGRFLTMTAIVTLGVAFFVGVSSAAPIMAHSVDVYDDETNMKDITVYANYGFDPEDALALADIEGIETVEAARFVDVIGVYETINTVTRVHGFTPETTVNGFVLREGRLPEKEDEALAEKGTTLSPGFALGTTVHLQLPDGSDCPDLSIRDVTIVGTIDTPLYLNQIKENSTLSNQYISTYLYVPETAFTVDYYTEINITVKGAKDLDTFSDAYRDWVSPVKKRIEEKAESQKTVRWQRLKDEAEEEYEKGMQEYLDGLHTFETETAEAREKLDDAWKQIEDGEQALNEGKETLASSREELDAQSLLQHAAILNGLRTIDENEALLNQAQAEVDANRAMLEENRKQLEEGVAAMQQAKDGLAQAEDALNRIEQLYPLFKKAYSVVSYLPPGTPVGLILELDEDVLALAESYGLSGEDSAADLLAFIDEMLTTMEQGREEAAAGRQKIEEALAQAGYADPDEGLADLAEKQALLEDGFRQLEAGQAEIDNGRKAIEEARRSAADGMATLEDALSDAVARIRDGQKEIEENEQKLADARKEAEQGESELAEKSAEAQAKLDDARRQLEEARETIDSLAAPEWMVLDRDSHYATATYQATVDQMKAIGDVFPVFFLLVAALVCLTTMTRMVYEQRGEIGVLRALGYTRMQCASTYLLYAAFATLIGDVIGLAVGMGIFPAVIYFTWRMMYILPAYRMLLPMKFVVFACFGFLLTMLGATWMACVSDLKEVPAQLMRPKAPKAGRELLIERIPFLWKRLGFSGKVALRNIFRDQRRLFMTVLGVCGCTALLVTGFGIRDSINNMVDLQFYDIYRFGGMVSYTDDKVREDLLSDPAVEGLYEGYSYTALVKGEDLEETVNVIIFNEKEDVEKAFSLRQRTGKKEQLFLNNAGVVLSEKLAENLGVRAGKVIRLEGEDGTEKEVIVSDIAEMYIRHYVFMSRECYERIFGREPVMKTAFVTLADDGTRLQQALAQRKDVESMQFFGELLDNFNRMVKGLNAVVWTLIISSMALAFVVLSNLISVNIAERQREIATLKVLGFRRREVADYVFRENNILTFAGALTGLPVGTALHHFIMQLVEMDYVMFGRDVLPLSYVYAVGLTMFFGLLVNRMMAPRLHEVKMVESLKSVE